MRILHDPSSMIEKLSYRIKQFKIDEKKRFAKFQCRTINKDKVDI